MYETILVPLDGSGFAEQVLPLARTLARRFDATLRLLRVHSFRPVDYRTDAELTAVDAETRDRVEAHAYVEELAERIDDAMCDPVVLENRSVVTAICGAAAESRAPLIVMTSHGRTGLRRALLGSVADGVVREATTPVLLWRPGDPPSDAPDSITGVLIALDGSAFSEAALPHAMHIASLANASVTLLRVVPPIPIVPESVAMMPFTLDNLSGGVLAVVDQEATATEVDEAQQYLGRVATNLRSRFPRCYIETKVVAEDRPGPAIVLAAAEAGADLVALATHGRGATRLIIGSTTDSVLRGRHGTTLIVRPIST